MENSTFNFFSAKSLKQLVILSMLLLAFSTFAQTTVTYSLGNTGYFTTQTVGTSGAFQNGAELGMYSNGGGTKNVVSYRDFKTAGDNTGSVRALQVGDVFSLQVYASAAFGQIGFSLNTSNVTTNYGTRNTNSRLYVQEDGTTGSWYVNSSAGNQTLDYNVSSTYRNYLFKVYITSETTCDVELIVDGTTTKRLFNRTMNGAAGANITGFALYLSDDYNGSGNANVYWKQVTEVRANTLVNMGYYLTTGNFTPGRITNGLTASSTSTPSVNALNIGGDAGTTVILNQPNTYSGATTVNANARGELQHAQALGNTSGVTVNTNGALSLYSPTGITFNNYPLTLNGNGQNGSNGALRNVGGDNTWTGNITTFNSTTINADISGSLTFTGSVATFSGSTLTIGGTQPITISGGVGTDGLYKIGTNTLFLNSTNNGIFTLGLVSGTVSIADSASLGLANINFFSDPSTSTLAMTNTMSINTMIGIQTPRAIFDVAASKTATLSGTIGGSGRINKYGLGTLVLTGTNSYSGGTNIANGNLRIFSAGNLGSGTIRLGYDATDVSQANIAALDFGGDMNIANNIIVAPNTGGMERRLLQIFIPAINNLSGNVTLNGTLSVYAPSGSVRFSGVLSGAGGITADTGQTALLAANTYSGNTTVRGNLTLGVPNAVPASSNLVLDGGTLLTLGNSDTMNLLALESNSTIGLGNGSHQLNFSNSSEEPWTGTLYIMNWDGTAGQSNTGGGRIFVGVAGLTSAQLQQIVFQGYSGTPIILPSGELVPPGPSLAVTAGVTDHGSVCVGTPATTITYTITNTGGDATGVDIGSDSEEFVVSNLSSTTIASGGTATFDVTFTPAIGGLRNGGITILTTTENSNTPFVHNITGTGITPTDYYADADSDTYGDANGTPITTCDAAPEGYVTSNTDCDDTTNQVHPGVQEVCGDGLDNDCNGLIDGDDTNAIGGTTYYFDNDGDGFGQPGTQITLCTAPANYVTNADDCNDSAILFQDNDGDGFGSETVMVACGGVPNNTDCDDAQTLYQDNDADGFGSNVKVDCGGATNSDDCNDAQVRYADSDADGFGSTTMVACEGSISNTDCDNTNALIHPNATEIGYNLIDDDCDGSIDEGFPPKNTVIQGAQCNTTLAAIDTQLVANLVAGAQGYRWRITTMNGPSAGQIQFLDTALRVMKITQLANYAFNTQYKVEVAVLFAGFWQPYAASNCTVTTPATVTSLAVCGQTLTGMSNVIYANAVPFSTGYRFRITDPLNGANTQIIDRQVREFRMNLITSFVVQYGKQYNVEVAIKNTDGSYLTYGNICAVTTPVFPTTSLQDSQCDDYSVPTKNTPIYAISYPGAIAYVFQVSGSGLPSPVEVTKTVRTFNLNDFPMLSPGATYNVRVRLVFNNADPAGPYGKICTIITPGLSRQMAQEFDAVAYPNPFADNFNIEFTTASEKDIIVKVYDMLGRLLETKSVKMGKVSSVQAGENYPSGVYNVVIAQGEETKTLRVVKR